MNRQQSEPRVLLTGACARTVAGWLEAAGQSAARAEPASPAESDEPFAPRPARCGGWPDELAASLGPRLTPPPTAVSDWGWGPRHRAGPSRAPARCCSRSGSRRTPRGSRSGSASWGARQSSGAALLDRTRRGGRSARHPGGPQWGWPPPRRTHGQTRVRGSYGNQRTAEAGGRAALTEPDRRSRRKRRREMRRRRAAQRGSARRGS